MKKVILTKYFSSPGKLGMCVNCNHKNCQNCSMGSVFPEVIHKYASDMQKISPYNSDFRYCRFRAIGNLCVDGPNCNFDGFPYSEFTDTRSGYGYTSFINKHAFVEHQSDNIEKSIGTLLGAYLNRFDTSKYGREWSELTSEERIDILNNRKPEEDGSIEVLMAVDAKLSPSIARMVDTDTEVGCSMGTNIEYSDCSVCGNRARFEHEYCNHVAFSKGSTVLVPANQIRNLLKEGKLHPEWLKWVLKREADQREVLEGKTSRMITASVFEINYGLSFFELSVVANPAYIRGYKLEKIASLLKKGFQELLPLVKVGDEEVEVHVDVTNEYFSSSTTKMAKEINKDFDKWADLEKVAYLRNGDIAKEALRTNQIKKVYVETENRSKFEKIGAKFISMSNPSFVQMENPEVLLNLTFAEKEDFVKFGAMEYKNTGLDLTDVHDFNILISQQGKQPQELVDAMYEMAGRDEKKLRDISDYIKMLQIKYKVVPRKYDEFEQKIIKDRGGKEMIQKFAAITETDVRQDSDFMKKIDQLSNDAQEKFIGAYAGAYNYKVGEGASADEAKEYAARTAWSKVPGGQKESVLVGLFVKKASRWTRLTSTDEQEESVTIVGKAADTAGHSIVGGTTIGKAPQTVILDLTHQGGEIRVEAEGEIEVFGEDMTGYDEESIVEVIKRNMETKESSKKAVYDGLPSTAEDIKDEGIKIEKTELKAWEEMSEKGEDMIDKEKKSQPHGVIFLEDSVSASKVVRDTLQAVRELRKQVKATIEVLAGELPPGLKEYMEKKKEEKGEPGIKPEVKPGEKKEEEEKPGEKVEKKPEERPELKPEERVEKKLEEKPKAPEKVQEVLKNTIEDLKVVNKDLEVAEEKLEEKIGKPLNEVLKGARRYSRNLKIAVEETLKEVKPIIEDAQEAIGDAQEIIKDTIMDLKGGPEKPKEKFEEKPKETPTEGGENVTKKLEEVVSNVESIKRAHDQLVTIFGEKKEATSYPPTGAKDPGDYGEPPVEKELSTWKGFNQEYEKMKGKEERTEFDTPEGRVDLLTGIVAKLFVSQEKRGSSYWLITRTGNDFAVKSAFVDVAGKDNQTDENFKKFCSNSYKLQILKAVSTIGLDNTRREMYGSWVKVMTKKAAEFVGKPIKEVPKGEYDTHEKDKKSGDPRKGVEPTDVKAGVNEKSYYSEAFGDPGYAAQLVKQNKDLKRKVQALETEKVADALAKRAVDLARKAAAVGAIPFEADAITEQAKDYALLDENAFEAVEKTLDSLPVVNSKALHAYQIPEAENVNSGVVYDATDSVRKERIEGKHPDLLKVDNMNKDVVDNAKLSKKKADFDPTIPPVKDRSRFDEVHVDELEIEPELEELEEFGPEVNADMKARIRKQANVVPQLNRHTTDLEGTKVPDFTSRFTTPGNVLRRKGLNYPPPVHYHNR